MARIDIRPLRNITTEEMLNQGNYIYVDPEPIGTSDIMMAAYLKDLEEIEKKPRLKELYKKHIKE